MKRFREKVSANFQLKLQPDRVVENAFRAYKASWETERLESEQDRQIFCEFIDLGQREKLEESSETSDGKITQPIVDKSTLNGNDSDDNDEEEEEVEAQVKTAASEPIWWRSVHVETNRPETLPELAAKKLGKSFVKGSVDDRVCCRDAINFGQNVDVNQPVLDLINLDNETFWKRVVQEKINDSFSYQKLLNESGTNWKRIGLELKFTEFVESLNCSDFDTQIIIEQMENLTEQLWPVLEEISIKTMKPKLSYEKNRFNPKYRIVNFINDECHHGSLKFLGRLLNLKRLSVKFDPGRLDRKYERRFFQISTVDVENVGKALKTLKKLEKFSLTRSDLSEPQKICHLMLRLKKLENLKTLDLSYCSISGGASGKHFADLIVTSYSLESLELKGNNLNLEFCIQFAHGLSKFQRNFKYLGLSMNPILGNGLGEIIKILAKCQVEVLNISNCDNLERENSEKCFQELIGLIRVEGLLRKMNLNGNNLTEQSIKDNFLKALEENYSIDEIDCEDTGFSTNDLVKIKALLMRNKYYKQNPILKKENFSAQDETNINHFLKRTKHPLLVKYKK